MITAIIIDDEEKGRMVLKQKLADHCPEITVIAEASNGLEGRDWIEKTSPDVVFLDIEMPRMNGFEMLNSLNEKNFHLIFTTAYDHYAIKAIRFAAFDYLMKPIDIDELKSAVNKMALRKPADVSRQLDILIHNTGKNTKNFNKIAIPTLDGISFFDLDDLIHLDSDSNYTMLHFTQGRKILSAKTLKDFEDQLSDSNFVRLHHSHIVNIHYITKYIKGEGGQVILSNGSVIDVSRRKKVDLLKMIY
jgi:two-component system LytT family response regulator